MPSEVQVYDGFSSRRFSDNGCMIMLAGSQQLVEFFDDCAIDILPEDAVEISFAKKEPLVLVENPVTIVMREGKPHDLEVRSALGSFKASGCTMEATANSYIITMHKVVWSDGVKRHG